MMVARGQACVDRLQSRDIYNPGFTSASLVGGISCQVEAYVDGERIKNAHHIMPHLKRIVEKSVPVFKYGLNAHSGCFAPQSHPGTIFGITSS